MIQKIFKIYPEWQRVPLFYPIALGFGIALYFALPFEPPLWIGPLALGISFFLFFISRHIWQLRALSPLLMLAALGFSIISFKTYFFKAPIIQNQIGPVLIEGDIIACDHTQKDTRLILSNLDIESLNAHETPKNIKVYAPKDFAYTISERISFKGMLMPPMKPLFESPYKGEIDAYYKQIGGVVFLRGLNTLYKVVTHHTPHHTIEEIRTKISDTIYTLIPNQIGAITTALITGKRDKINDETMLAFQRSGLAHILAISGLHVGMFFGVILLSVRFFLSLFPFIALRFSTKKIAACFGLVAAFGYTLLAGSTYPTLRSFLMLSLIFIALLFDKRVLSLRTLAFAALAILLFLPEAVLSASFQLSFAAVAGLIAFYEQGYKSLNNLFLNRNSRRAKTTLYVLTLITSSVIATLATTPFTLYHFGQAQILGVFSNLIAIPAMGVIVMPFIVLFCLSLPFGFSDIFLTPLSYGVDLIYQTALFVGAFEYSALYTKPFTHYGFLLMTFGFLWAVTLQNRWRLLGCVFFIAATLPPFFEPLPDVILTKNGKGFVYRTEGNDVYSNLKKGSFAEKVFTQRYNQNIPMLPLNDNPHCDKMLCQFQNLTYIRNKNADIPENPPLLINPFDDAGTFKNINALFYFEKEGLRIKTGNKENKRPWD